MQVTLMSPIWGSGFRGKESFGINERFLIGKDVTVVCTYRNRWKNRVFPSTYKMSVAKAMTYKLMTIQGNRIRVIPVKDFDEMP